VGEVGLETTYVGKRIEFEGGVKYFLLTIASCKHTLSFVIIFTKSTWTTVSVPILNGENGSGSLRRYNAMCSFVCVFFF